MKSGLSCVSVIFSMIVLFFIGCGEGDYNTNTLSPDINDEINTNQSNTNRYNEHWQRMSYNPSGSVTTTDLTTQEETIKTYVIDDNGLSRSIELSITITKTTDDSFSTDGKISFDGNVLNDSGSRSYTFLNLPMTFDDTETTDPYYVGRACTITGTSPVSDTGAYTASFVINLKQISEQIFYGTGDITDRVKNEKLNFNVNVFRTGGNGPMIAFPEPNNELWEEINVNPEGAVITTNNATNETTTKTYVMDDAGFSDSVDLSITITKSFDGSFNSEGEIILAGNVLSDLESRSYTFTNLPMAVENTNNTPIKYSIIGESSVSGSSGSNHIYAFNLEEMADLTYTFSAEITDNIKNENIQFAIGCLRTNGKGPIIAFPEK